MKARVPMVSESGSALLRVQRRCRTVMAAASRLRTCRRGRQIFCSAAACGDVQGSASSWGRVETVSTRPAAAACRDAASTGHEGRAAAAVRRTEKRTGRAPRAGWASNCWPWVRVGCLVHRRRAVSRPLVRSAKAVRPAGGGGLLGAVRPAPVGFAAVGASQGDPTGCATKQPTAPRYYRPDWWACARRWHARWWPSARRAC
mmetsp:Transcript_8518/g.21514  ORF Transcript_8518/g.21514 Transcript_8518/m.21514 type:complete len:202 (+) Transcript_8518:1311-1916(+)